MARSRGRAAARHLPADTAQRLDTTLAATDRGFVTPLHWYVTKLREFKVGGQPIDLHVVAGWNPEYRFVAPTMKVVQEEGLGKLGLTAPAASGPATSP